MFNYGVSARFLGTAVSALLCMTAAAPAQAFTWNYNYDSFTDGTGDFLNGAGHGVGDDSKYEIFGAAYGYDQNIGKIFFAINANTPLLGHASTNAKDGNIGWGDLFINLDPSKTFTQVQGTSSLLGIRFAATNDSGIDPTTNGGHYTTVTTQVPRLNSKGQQIVTKGVPQFRTVTTKVNANNGVTGIYQGVTTANVTGTNNGWSNYTSYNKYVASKKGTVELIDGMTLTDAQNYLGAHGYSVIGSGSKIGDIALLNRTELSALGLNFGPQMGDHTGCIPLS